MPALCPRIRLRLTEAPLPEDQRVAGEGTLDQVRADLEALQEMGGAVCAVGYLLWRYRRDTPS